MSLTAEIRGGKGRLNSEIRLPYKHGDVERELPSGMSPCFLEEKESHEKIAIVVRLFCVSSVGLVFEPFRCILSVAL